MNIDQLEKNLERVQSWIKNADDKVSILLAFDGLYFIFLVEKVVSKIRDAANQKAEITMMLYGAAIFFFLWSLLKALSAVYPRLKHNHADRSLLYFTDIAAQTFEEFSKAMTKSTAAKYKEDLTRQIHSSSIIAAKKFTAFKDALFLTLLSLTLLGLTAICQRGLNL